MIGIAGVARSGKDTLARTLVPIIEKDLSKEVRTYSFAEQLKMDADPFLREHLGISAFETDTEVKKIIRPILVGYGEAAKKVYGKYVWCQKLHKQINEERKGADFFPMVTDVRFDFEAKYLQEEFGARVIHISRIGNQPANETEAANDPLAKAASDLQHTWPTFVENDIDEVASNHATILWQMVFQEVWKKISH